MSALLFTKILENNQLINGRLNADQSDLEKLFMVLQKDSEKLIRKQTRQEEIIKSSISKRHEIKLQIKRISESIQKSFHPSSEKISLMYKKMGDIYYIKARFYWEGKQREVQVGSIPSVLKIINKMIVNKSLTSLKPIRTKKLTWNEIKKKPNLLSAIKKIASIKSQEYILRKLMFSKLNISGSIDITTIEKDETPRIPRSDSHNPENYKSESIKETNVENCDNWYERWRKDNL